MRNGLDCRALITLCRLLTADANVSRVGLSQLLRVARRSWYVKLLKRALSRHLNPHDPCFLFSPNFYCFRLTKSDMSEPVNLGSDEMISMNDMGKMVLGFEGKDLPIKHIPGPEGVRGRNSDNTLIKEKLGWAPSVKLADGLKITYFWIKDQVAKEGGDASQYGTSTICGTAAPKELGTLREADGKEAL